MTLARYVHAMGRGPGRSRNLDQAEARDAMRLILSQDADPHAIGALLMLMRYRGKALQKSQVLHRPSAQPCLICPRLIWTGQATPPDARAGCRGSCWRRGWWRRRGRGSCCMDGTRPSRTGQIRARRCLWPGSRKPPPPNMPRACWTGTELPFCRWNALRRARWPCCACARFWACGPASTLSVAS